MQPNRRPDHRFRPTPRRHGFTTPAVAIAMLIMMMGLALIIDRIWLETAQFELMTAAEAAALAAASELANDDLLLPNPSANLRIANGLQTAEWIASQNYVAGQPVTLNIDPEGDVRFGNLVSESEGVQFQESNVAPNTVVVTALRTRPNSNPVALFIAGATGLPYGDVAARVEATVNNDVVGLRPYSGTPIPGLPIAIWEVDPSGERSDTWDATIVSRQGTDQYSFDADTNTVISGSDGIPELIIHSMPTSGNPSVANVQLVDVGTALADNEMTRQFQSGMNVTDLEIFGGSVFLGQGVTLQLNSTAQFDSAVVAALENLIGQRRICFLYSTATSPQQGNTSTATCTEIVAIRVMAVAGNSDGSCSITVQPTVMTSHTVMLSTENNNPTTGDTTSLFDAIDTVGLTSSADSTTTSNPSATTNAVPNPYLYKLRLTQ